MLSPTHLRILFYQSIWLYHQKMILFSTVPHEASYQVHAQPLAPDVKEAGTKINEGAKLEGSYEELGDILVP